MGEAVTLLSEYRSLLPGMWYLPSSLHPSPLPFCRVRNTPIWNDWWREAPIASLLKKNKDDNNKSPILIS